MPTNRLTGKVEYASRAQRGFMHAKHPKIAARWDREIKAQRRVRKGLKRDLALGLTTGTIGGVAANQLPQNQTPTKAALKATGRKRSQVRKASSAPEIGVSGLGAAQRERRKATAQSLGYGAASAATGTAGLGMTAARWAPKALHRPAAAAAPAATRAGAAAASKTPSKGLETAARALHSSDAGRKAVDVSRWAKKNPKKALAIGAGLKATSLAAGVASRYRGQEASGLSHEIGTTRGVKRHMREVKKAVSSDRGKAVRYTYLDPMPTRVAGDGGVAIRNPIKPLDAMAAANLANIPAGQGRRRGLFRRSKQDNNLRRSYGQQLQTSLGVGRARS